MTSRNYSPIALSVGFVFLLTACPSLAAQNDSRGTPWPIHVIDASSRGADGVRLADVNGDRLMDVTTGWEEGGITRVYLHPGRRDRGAHAQRGGRGAGRSGRRRAGRRGELL